MTTIRDKFEAVFLDGKSADNILVSSQLQLGADGEYFNSNTRALYRFFCAGASSVVVELPAPIEIEQVGVGCTFHSEYLDVEATEKAIEAAGGTVAN